MNTMKRGIVEFVKFGIVGASNTVISLLIYYIFLWISPNYYLLGNVIGWVVSVANSFVWNSKFVFHTQFNGMRDALSKLIRAYISYGSVFLITMALLYLQVDILGWSAKLAPVINLLITIPLNFILNKLWTFGK